MALKLLIAGCSSDERDTVASIAKSVLGRRSDAESWNISMVKVANKWSVTIDGPEPRYKGLSFVATTEKLAGELAGELDRAAQNTAAAGDPVSANELKDRYECAECASPYEVVYAAHPDEPRELSPVACPHCWHVNEVPIAEGAGATGDYRAQAPSS